MAIETTYTQARANLKALLDQVSEDREPVIIRRKNGDVAMVAADELRGLMETAYLLRSPKNAERLLRTLRRVQKKQGRPSSIEELKAELGLNDE